ncbi:MAG TPA: hypothetical protein VFF27_02775 [Bacteroidia bacterium]|nr:hypothetical protein [Bacteroidia bacterium]
MLIHCSKVANKKKCALRKAPSTFSFETVDSAHLIKADHWNSIVPFGSEFLKLPYLYVWEKAHAENMRFHYTIIYDQNKPVAIGYFQVIDFNGENFESIIEMENNEALCRITAYLQKHLANHLKRNADKINMRLLICGNSFISGEHGFTHVPDINKPELIDALADVIYSIGKTEKLRGKIAAVLVKDFYITDDHAADELSEFKYHDFVAEPNMILPIQWSSMDDYLNAMSKKYRHRAKGIIKKGEVMERKIFSVEEITTNEQIINQLYKNVHLKAKFRLATLPASYFAEMKRELKDKFVFTAYYFQENLVGFRSTFILNKEIEAHFIGIDYNLNKQLELYQNMLYDYVKEAITRGTNKLILGRTASEIKSTIGAEAVELKCYIRHHNPLSNRIIKPFVDYLKPAAWIPRNPFKDAELEPAMVRSKS